MKTFIVKVRETKSYVKQTGFLHMRTKTTEESKDEYVEIYANDENEARSIIANQIEMMKKFKICMLIGNCFSVRHSIVDVSEKH